LNPVFINPPIFLWASKNLLMFPLAGPYKQSADTLEHIIPEQMGKMVDAPS
jgi:hypothetical protein